MLTPRFELSQTETEVVVKVHAPYANIKDTEVHIDGTDFRFYSTPYYLRLKLPGEIVENDESSGSYDCDKGEFVLKFSKVTVGQHFENLDMITTLLAPPKENKNFFTPKIEVIGNPAANDGSEGSDGDDEKDDADDDDIDWSIPQTIQPNSTTRELSISPKYGFANKISGALTAFHAAWLKEIIDLPRPDYVPMENRKVLREARELEDFNEDHYMVDLIGNEGVEPYTSFVPEWETLKTEEINLNDKEKDLLKELPNKEYLLDNEEMKIVLCGMVDILYGSCYNNRITMGENTSESSWDVNKLSSTLSWFQVFSNMEEVIRACIRRSLCYPLCRHWDLSIKTFEDVKKVIKLGKKYIIKRFCEIHEIFNDSHEPRYLLNQLYIKDYLIWLQRVTPNSIELIVPILDAITPRKADMDLELEELETAAWSIYSESLVFENDINDVANKMAHSTLDDNKKGLSSVKQKIENETESDSDSDSSSDSSSNSSSSSSTSSSGSNSSTSSTSSTCSSDCSCQKHWKKNGDCWERISSTDNNCRNGGASIGKDEKLDSDDLSNASVGSGPSWSDIMACETT